MDYRKQLLEHMAMYKAAVLGVHEDGVWRKNGAGRGRAGERGDMEHGAAAPGAVQGSVLTGGDNGPR